MKRNALLDLIRTILFSSVVLFGSVIFYPVQSTAAELIMVEQEACEWCEEWEKNVGVIYNQTAEGKRAPIRKLTIHSTLPNDLSFLTNLVFTPTFILVDQGEEVGRIIGYPGEDFFWGMLAKMLAKLPAPPSQ